MAKYSRRSGKLIAGSGTYVVLALSPLGAFAQEPAEGVVLEQITVTAQKRSERIQDVPIAVSAFSGEQLEERGITDFRDLLRSVPGVSFSRTEPGQSVYSIRGISTQASSPTVGVYLDDVSLVTIRTEFAGAADPPFLDLERVEVLKGPQGTLYGGSAMGGAIKYVTRQPVLDETSVNAAGDVSSTDHGGVSYGAESVVNLPLVQDRLALRGGISFRDTAGFIDSVPNAPTQSWGRSTTQPPAAFAPATQPSLSTYGKSNYDDWRSLALRLSAKYVPSDTLTIVPTATFTHNVKDNPSAFWTNLPSFEVAYRFRQPTTDSFGIYSLNITKNFGAIDFVSLTAASNRTLHWDRDYSYFIGTLVPPLFAFNSYNYSNTYTRTVTQELRLASADPTARLKWTTGLFLLQQRDELVQWVNTPGLGAALGTGNDIGYSGDQTTHDRQYAVFADVTYSLTSKLDFSAGLRWFESKQELDGTFDGILNGGHTEVNGKRNTNVGFNPKYSVIYRLADHHLTYATASKGFREGGPNRFNTSSPLCQRDFDALGIKRAPDSYAPDSLWTYELGSKNVLADGSATVNFAAYYTDWKNIQQQVNLLSCGFQFVGNVGAATVKGAELELETRITHGLTLGGSATYTQSEITESAPGVSARVGQTVLDTPKWMGNVFTQYEFPLAAGSTARIRAEYQYHGSDLRAFESTTSVAYPDGSRGVLPNTTQTQEAFRVLNLNFNVTRGNWQYRAYANNLLNSNPLLEFVRNAGDSHATTLQPRTIGIATRVTF
jgi:outer membrane receptor protein involved in Fe transport